MPILSTLATAAPWHVLSFGTLFGMQFFQTFIGGVVAYRALTRPQFSQLQQKIFPIYFSLQSALPVALLLTFPGAPASALLSPSSPLFASHALPILAVLGTSLLNLAVIGPATTKTMMERKVQETKDGKKYHDDAPKSKEMLRLNKKFARIHGISSLLNLLGLVATGWYGVTLSESLRF
ncbi:hypothetical protein RUND412_002704 [Rhizina undulata]